jgi:hypothetical protein
MTGESREAISGICISDFGLAMKRNSFREGRGGGRVSDDVSLNERM